MTFKNEADMQKRIEQLLHDEMFGQAIRDRDLIEKLADPAPDVLPIFAIDRVMRKAMIAAARDALADVDELIVLTSDNNISMRKGESLRPDFICLAPSTRRVYLIELKKSSQTAREAVTELLGYEHEIKNYLPFLANYDLSFVLIATDWSTLLDHSAASACCWSGKQMLCLKADLEKGVVTLAPHIPDAWSITGVTEFPRKSLQTFQITIEGPAADEEGLPDPRLLIVMNLLARLGDRAGAHGFAMLWRDRADRQLKTFHITLGGVDPLAFFEAAVESGMIDPDRGHLTAPLRAAAAEASRTAPGSLVALFHMVRPLLEEIASVTIEGFLDWETARQTFVCRAEPVSFEYWGILGDHARAYFLNPAVRTHRASLLDGGRMDWTEPFLGLFLLQSFSGAQFLRDGEVRPSDAFSLGSVLGIDGALRELINNPKAASSLHVLEPAFVWNAYSAAYMLEELILITNSSKSIGPLGAPLPFSLNPIDVDWEQRGALFAWFSREVLRGQKLFVAAFEFGLRGGLFLSSSFCKATGNDFRTSRATLAPELARFRKAALDNFNELLADGRATTEQEMLARKVAKHTICDDRSATEVFRLLDTLVPAVPHDLNAVAPSTHDWSWIKQGVCAVRQSGGRAAVVLGADGKLGTMRLENPVLLMMGDVDDLETGVLFLNNLSGIQLLDKTTWEALMRGDHFPVLPTQ